MEVFTKTKVVTLKSHLDKYLIADDDQENIRQSRCGSSRNARWIIEQLEDNDQVIRIRSCHGKYLTTSEEASLRGMTSKKVIQAIPEDREDSRILWHPMKDGFLVKLKAYGGTYLRANGKRFPWRSSVTHDSSFSGPTYNWTLWDVEAIEVTENQLLIEYVSMVSSFSSVSDEISKLDIGPPRLTMHSIQSPMVYRKNCAVSRSAMYIFRNAKTVRLRSIHNKCLAADDNEESVKQDQDGWSRNSKWNVEIVQNADNIIRLKSCYNKYLTASNQPFFLGMTGKKVIQTLPKKLDSSVEWEPIKEGGKVKLRTRYGHFLRANAGLPPWRNSVTNDIPHRTATKDWVFWDVDVVDVEIQSLIPHRTATPLLTMVPHSDSFASETSSNSTSSSKSTSFSRLEMQSNDSMGGLDSPRSTGGEGRMIYFHVANKFGEYDEEEEEFGIKFKGNDVGELRNQLEEVVPLDDVIVCTRSPLDEKLYPLRLKLPPNNISMHVVLVPSSSNGCNGF